MRFLWILFIPYNFNSLRAQSASIGTTRRKTFFEKNGHWLLTNIRVKKVIEKFQISNVFTYLSDSVSVIFC